MGTARAKVNLFLHVLGRRADGYHALQSLVVFADVGDALTIEPGNENAVRVEGPFAGALEGEDPSDNLIAKARAALADLHKETRGEDPPPVMFRLRKELPVAAGVGGGSADAAEALRMLMEVWDFHPAKEALESLALTLGADVPVALRGAPVLMEGIGEILSPLQAFPEFPALLVNPRVPVPTGPVFKALAAPPLTEPTPEPPGIPHSADADAWLQMLRAARNDLEPPARQLHPEVGRCLDALTDLPGARLARMSGSGGTCFALFETEAQAIAAGETLARAQPGWWIRPTCFQGTW